MHLTSFSLHPYPTTSPFFSLCVGPLGSRTMMFPSSCFYQLYSCIESFSLFSIHRVWPPLLLLKSWRETVLMNWSLPKELQSTWSLPGSWLEGCSVWCGSRLASASSPLELNLREGTSPALTMWVIFPFRVFFLQCTVGKKNTDKEYIYGGIREGQRHGEKEREDSNLKQSLLATCFYGYIFFLTPVVLGHHPHCCRRCNWLLWLLPRIQEYQHHCQLQESGATGQSHMTNERKMQLHVGI